MVHVKDYETVSTFVEVMQKKNRDLFFSDCYFYLSFIFFKSRLFNPAIRLPNQ